MPEVSTISPKASKTSKETNGEVTVSETALKGNGLFKVVSGEIKKVRKRNGRLMDFDVTKIVNAAYRALLATEEGGEEDAVNIAKKAYLELLKGVAQEKAFTPSVEEIQDLVEKHLIFANYAQTAKAYILYRKEHADLRERGEEVPREVKNLAMESSKHFNNSLAEFVYLRTYSRWRDDLGRREFWVETVERFMDFMKENLGKKLSTKDFNEVRQGILNQEVIPSMRLLWSAGTAVRNTHVAAYNCSFVSISELRDFPEIMYISMCGTGVGFSVEEKSIERLPIIESQTGKKT